MMKFFPQIFLAFLKDLIYTESTENENTVSEARKIPTKNGGLASLPS